MKFSIITPTLQRESLVGCCQSINYQTFQNWEHILFVDGEKPDWELIESCKIPSKRMFYHSAIRHNDYGNTPRHEAWKVATGDYVLYLDDDNYLADDDVLGDIAKNLQDSNGPDFAVFPILRHGQIFFTNLPRSCHIDTANLVIKREFAQWPKIPDYTADGIFAESLVRNHSFVAFADSRPIVIMEKSNEGK